jgi:hypothetical protein
VIEAGGVSTVTLNMLWPYQRLIGMPRVAAIEHPFGRPYGDVDDAATQTAVLRAALRLAETAREPGWVEQLPGSRPPAEAPPPALPTRPETARGRRRHPVSAPAAALHLLGSRDDGIA